MTASDACNIIHGQWRRHPIKRLDFPGFDVDATDDVMGTGQFIPIAAFERILA